MDGDDIVANWARRFKLSYEPPDDNTVLLLESFSELTTNAFCPTGKGGGVKATCPPGGGKTRPTPSVQKAIAPKPGHVPDKVDKNKPQPHLSKTPEAHPGLALVSDIKASNHPLVAKIAQRLGRLGAGAKAAEHVAAAYVQDKVAQNMQKLPPGTRAGVEKAWAVGKLATKAAFAGWTASQAFAERVAQERGMTPEHAKAIRGLLSNIDMATFKPIALLGGPVAHATFIVPPATAGYLAYSAARHPLATARAAKGLVADGVKKLFGKSSKPHNMLVSNAPEDPTTSPDMKRLLDVLDAHEYDDWFLALFHVAMDETGDVNQALDVAAQLYDENPKDPTEGQDEQGAAELAVQELPTADQAEKAVPPDLAPEQRLDQKKPVGNEEGGLDEGVENSFCPTGQGGGVDPHCGGKKYAILVSSNEKLRLKKLAARMGFNSLQEVPEAVGAPAGAKVAMRLTFDDNGRRIGVSLRNGDELGIPIMERYLAFDAEGKKYMHNAGIAVAKTGGGEGTKIFRTQVESAVKHGFDYIRTDADASGTSNGYYTWPRLGYDKDIHSTMLVKLPSELKGATKVSDLMKTPEGREWWKKNGTTLKDARFDLKDGSLSRKVFDEYVKQKFGAPTGNAAGLGRGGRQDLGSDLGRSQVSNAFCPTGQGGGIDPHCKPGEGVGREEHPVGETTFVKALPGSTNPSLVKDIEGTLWVEKKNKDNPGHIRNEHDADKAYKAIGVPTPHSALAEGVDGPIKYGKFIKDGVQLNHFVATNGGDHDAAVKEMYQQIGKHFVADALLANWDSVGTGANNILIKNGTAYRIDNGGSLGYRAQGTKKTAQQFPASGVVAELHNMRDPNKAPDAAKVFGHLTDADVAQQIKEILPKKQAVLDAISDVGTRNIVAKRFDFLKDWAAFNAKVIPTAPKPNAALEAKLEKTTGVTHPQHLKEGDKFESLPGTIGAGPYTLVAAKQSGDKVELFFKETSLILSVDPHKSIGEQGFKLAEEGPGPLPKTYGGLQPGHKYKNTQGVTKEVESVYHDKDAGNVHVKFKGEIGEAVVPASKPFKFSEPTVEPAGTPTKSHFAVAAGDKPVASPVKKVSGTVVAPAFEGVVKKSSVKATHPGDPDMTDDHGMPTAQHLVNYLKKTNVSGVLSPAFLEKVKILNPDGLTGGFVVMPVPFPNSKAWKPHMDHLKSVLPPGTTIQTVVAILAKNQGKGGGGKKGLSKASFTDAPVSKFGSEATGEASETDTAALEHHSTIIKALSHDERSAVRWYTGPGGALNSQMRKCPPNFECVQGVYKQYMDNIQSAIDKVPVFPNPVTVRRGINLHGDTLSKFVASFSGWAANGQEITLPSFTSTSLKHGFSGNVRLEIQARQGLYVQSLSAHKSEYEVILSSKARFKVLEVLPPSGGHTGHLIKLEQLV
jgi:hypothetical protein